MATVAALLASNPRREIGRIAPCSFRIDEVVPEKSWPEKSWVGSAKGIAIVARCVLITQAAPEDSCTLVRGAKPGRRRKTRDLPLGPV
ncbi:hypothetical protein [Croceicoccus marinus]|uniref:hypothetical protein n=1 Tax=Croceicoccus marinus TaxID=450378 RepID=UPI0018DFFC8D|nr:hypothetical protein [Croceicoccus marinus]